MMAITFIVFPFNIPTSTVIRNFSPGPISAQKEDWPYPSAERCL